MMDLCTKCSCTLSDDEKALYKKLCNKYAKEYMCISCLAQYFKVSTELLVKKIDMFKKQGCTLFVQRENEADNF